MLALITFFVSFLLSYLGTVLLLRLQPRERFVDVPNDRSSHESPKPRFGGLAIVTAVLLVFGVLLFVVPGATRHLPLLIGGGIVFAVGVLDDRRSLGVAWRFAAQGAAVALLVATGHVVDHIYLPLVGTIELGVVAIPFTVLFVLTSINFYNFIDGIDGLAAGSAFIAAGFLALIAFMLGHIPLALICLAVAGSAVAFLQFNFPPSRLFMGDSGSTFLGFFFAYVAIAGNALQPEIPFFIPVLLLSSLYLDAGLTLIKRAIRGEKIFQPHHTHYYQRLLSLGFNHKQVTLLEYGLTILLGISAVIFIKAGGLFPFFLTMVWVIVFVALILKIQGLERGDRMFWERRSLLVIGGDLVLIALAYFGAYFLRTSFRFTDPEGIAVVKAFPFVLVVRSATFYWYGLYRGVWKYTSTPDVLRIIKAVTTGSVIILALVVLFYRFVAFPRSLFVIEYALLILVLSGSRFASRLFHEFGKEAHGANVKRLAIIGAGDYGERLGREIRNADGKTVEVVCHIDDDKNKRGLVLRGVPIVGPIDDLADLCRRFDVDEIILGISDLSHAKLKSIVQQAREAGIRLEARPGGYAQRSHVGAVELDRIGRNLGRGLPVEPAGITAKFCEGKRVLITHGGEDMGPELGEELTRLGATVVVHVDGRRDAERFVHERRGQSEVIVSPLADVEEARRVLSISRPDVIFHCTSLDIGGVMNLEDYMASRIVRSTTALCDALRRHSVESLVFLNFWGRVSPDSPAAHLSAISEITVLNSPDLLAAAPKVLRLPSILTGRELAMVLTPGEQRRGRYSLLEAEAVAMVIDASANYRSRVIVVPRGAAPLEAPEIPKVLSGASVHRLSADASHEPKALFPNEALKPSILRGAQEVVSPFYPASEELIAVASEYAGVLRTDSRGDSLVGLQSALFRRVGSSIE